MGLATARLLAAAALVMPFAALAGPSDYVFEPSVSYGERAIDFKYGTGSRARRRTIAPDPRCSAN